MSDIDEMRVEPSQEDDFEEIEIVVTDQEIVEPEPEPTKEPEEFQELSRDDLIQKIETARESAKQPDPTEVMAQGLAELNKNLSRPPEQPQQFSQQPLESDADFIKRMNEEFLTAPADFMEEFQRRKLGPELALRMKNNKESSRRFAKMDSDLKFIMDTYPDEVEKAVAALTPFDQYQVDCYEKAAQMVKVRHIDDIVERKMAEQLKKLDDEREKAKAKIKPSVTHTESLSRPAPKKKTVHIKPDLARELGILGIQQEDYVRYIENE